MNEHASHTFPFSLSCHRLIAQYLGWAALGWMGWDLGGMVTYHEKVDKERTGSEVRWMVYLALRSRPVLGTKLTCLTSRNGSQHG